MRYPMLYNTDKVAVEVNRIRSLRKEKGMKQAELAAMLQCAPTAVSKYELGQLDISSDTICNDSRLFDFLQFNHLSGITPGITPGSK